MENLENGLRTAIRKVKSIFKNPIKRWAIIAIAAFAIIIIALGSAYDSLTDAFSKGVSEHMQNNPVQYEQDSEQSNAIKITDETIDELIKTIKKMGINLDHLKLKKEDIAKFYAAEVVSSEINRSVQSSGTLPEVAGKYYGRVFVERANPDTGELERLIFEPSLSTFEAMDASQILNYFSMDGDKICFASTEEIKDGDGNIISTNVTINKQSYKDNISQYTVPIEFLLDLCLTSQNPGFIKALADKIINETEIIIQILQDEEEITTTTTYKYAIETETSTKTYDYDGDGKFLNSDTDTPDPTVSNAPEEVSTQVQKRIKSSIQIHSVKNWIMEVQCDYNKVPGGDTQPLPVVKIDDEEKGEHHYTYSETVTHEDTSYTKIYTSTISRKVNQTTQDTITTKTITYQAGTSTGVQYEEKVKEFVKMLNTPYSVPGTFIKQAPKGKLESGSGLLFQMLANGDRTQSLELLMRHILELATGNNYGASDFKFDTYNIRQFITVGSANGGIEEILKSYENEALRKYMNGQSAAYSSVSKYVTQDKKQYKMYYTSADGCLNFSYGIMVRNREGILNNTSYFAEEGLDLQSLVNQYDNGQEVLVDAEKIDRIFKRIVQDKKQVIKGQLEKNGASLKSNELDALVNVAYQYGNCGQYISGENNIANLYNTYYMTGQEETFKQKAVAQTRNGLANFFVENGSNRKKYNWILFTEGKYTLSDGTEISAGNSEIVEFASQFIGEYHTKFTSYNPTNGVKDVWFRDDWCAMFVSYCYNECGLIPDVLQEPYAGCSTEVSNLKARNQFIYANSGYVPKPGDIIFFTKNSGITYYHTGIVESCDGTTIYTIEGNTGNSSTKPYWKGSRVERDNYLLTDVRVGGYFSVNGG